MKDIIDELGPRPKLLVLQGIPASGKTTYARELVKNSGTWVRVNRDDLRNMRGDYWVPSQEKLISSFEFYCIRVALESGYNVVSDSTNLNLKTIAILTQIAKECNVEIEFKLIEVELEEALRRDALRPNPVGEVVITTFYNNYIKNGK